MTVHIRVRNFQSLKDATLDVQGFTVITGPNNSGKTALVRAIRGAIQNTRGSSFVRHGEAKAIVDLKFDDGRTLTWEKGAKVKPTYILDGGEPLYPGSGVPDEVREFGIRPIEAGGKDIWPQIAPQFHQVFLIDQAGSVLAEAVADVERVSQLNRALKASKSDHAKTSTTLQIRLTDVKNYTAELSLFDGLDEVVVEVQEIEAGLQKGEQIQRAVVGFSALLDRLQEAEGAVDFLAGIEQIELPPETDVQAASKLLETKEMLGGLRGRLEAAKAQEAHWAPLDGVQAPPTEALRKDLDGLRELQDLSSRREAAKTDEARWAPLEGVGVPPAEVLRELGQTLKELGEKRGLSTRLDAAKAGVTQWEALGGVKLEADEIQATKVLAVLGGVRVLQQRWTSATERCSALETEVQKAVKVEADTEAAVQALLVELGECPVCKGECPVCKGREAQTC
jgi:exonuclease SbcC